MSDFPPGDEEMFPPPGGDEEQFPPPAEEENVQSSDIPPPAVVEDEVPPPPFAESSLPSDGVVVESGPSQVPAAVEAGALAAEPTVTAPPTATTSAAATTAAAAPVAEQKKQSQKKCDVCAERIAKAIVDLDGVKTLVCVECVTDLQRRRKEAAATASSAIKNKMCQRCNVKIREAKVCEWRIFYLFFRLRGVIVDVRGAFLRSS